MYKSDAGNKLMINTFDSTECQCPCTILWLIHCC